MNIEDKKQLKDLKARNYLFQVLDHTILEIILNKDTSKSTWNSMKQKYQGTTRVQCALLQALRTEFEILHVKVGEFVNEFFVRTLIIVNMMKANGEVLEDGTIIQRILRSVTSKFNYVVCNIEESRDTSILTIVELQSNLLVHEQCMRSHDDKEHALKIIHGDCSSGWTRGCGSFKGKGRGRGYSNDMCGKK
ncbi:hypothetical protein J1N35_015483 [Gossypium stocksii]|uniref:Retrovirus-related Pol polyprotein from transposon TNT 1-94 n=1 Tax=Gossypium stocksii TaxID=47602 RepID=A0A9D3VWD5_9ROSI|nr:hypothetical protein J1N35_015483 [Gossypium stocksii]